MNWLHEICRLATVANSLEHRHWWREIRSPWGSLSAFALPPVLALRSLGFRFPGTSSGPAGAGCCVQALGGGHALTGGIWALPV